MPQQKLCKTCQRLYESERDFLTNTSRWRYGTGDLLYYNCSCGSTLVLRKGQYDWFSPEKLLSMEAGRVFNQVGFRKNIPTVSADIIEIQEALKDENISSEALAQRIRHNPVLVSDLIRLANISKRSQEQEIRSVEHALVYVGRTVLSELVTALTLKNFEFKTTALKKEQYWREAFIGGMVAEHLIAEVPCGYTPDEAFLAGALCNIGKIVGAVCTPEEIDRVYQLTETQAMPWEAAEKQLNAVSHQILGEIAATFWGMPSCVLKTTIAHHRVPEGKYIKPDDQLFMTLIVYANQATHWLLGQSYRIDLPLMQQAFAKLKLPYKDPTELLTNLRPAAKQVLQMF